MAAESLGKWVAMLGTMLLASGCATLTPLSGHGVALGQGARVSHAGTLSRSAGNTYLEASSAAASTNEGEEARLRRRRPGRASTGTAVIAASPADMAVLAVETGMLEVDAFEKLLVLAGLGDTDVLPPRVNPFPPEEAARLLALLVETPVTLGNFPPRMAVGHLLREVLEGREVSRAELLRRVARFQGVAVLRPDGYLAWVRNGRTQQRVAEVEWKDGAFRAHGFELGRFYGSQGGIFRLLDAQFRELNEGAYAEVYDDADVVSRTLDGAEDAFVELYLALGHFFTYPTDSILALRHLPAGVAALIASSPEYWERFRYMTAGEQMKAVARLSTSLLIAGGSTNGVTRTLTSAMGGAEAMVPVLSLSAQGALAIQRVAVPVGKVTTAVGHGVGGVYVLSTAAGAGGQGTIGGPVTGGGATGGNRGSLQVIPGGSYSPSELNSAQALADAGRNVVLRPPVGTRTAGGTSDLLVDGVRYDVYTPTTTNANRIISAIAKKNSQAEGIVLDLSQTSVTRAQLGNVLERVRGVGANNIRDVIILGGN
ncbi:hypothetical protein ACN6A1_01645 [Myxococcus virescens]|uniref:CdiA C-terminal domain-containing protein n=1 Tax=Myxococcus virescens TaxID=83456 RepID=UPI003DA48342